VSFEPSRQFNGEASVEKWALDLPRTQPYPAAQRKRRFTHSPITN
jgi:hypothetical protein